MSGLRIGSLLAVLILSAGCASGTTDSTALFPTSSSTEAPDPAEGPDVILTGTIVTMSDPGRVEAIALDDGFVVAVGTRETVLATAGSSTVVIDLGDSVAYPGFVDPHSHWIGDREHYGVGPPEEAIALALEHGWTSIAELWVHQPRLSELLALDSRHQLRVRVDAYLALNLPAPTGEHLGNWQLAYEAGMAPSDRLRVPGVKITIDSGWGTSVWWEPEDLKEAYTTAHDAGWQIASHTISTESLDMVLDAFEVVLDGGPNTLRHRIEHAIQVTDEQLQRISDLGLVIVGHLEGLATDAFTDPEYLDSLGEDTAWLMRWRDFVDAGIPFASAVDVPWLFPDLNLTPDVGRPQDVIASGMDGMGVLGAQPPPEVLAQTLTAEQALHAVTLGAAFAIGADDLRGHLAPGTYADITILSGDIMGATPDEIRQMRVLATIVGGVTEFCADSSVCP